MKHLIYIYLIFPALILFSCNSGVKGEGTADIAQDYMIDNYKNIEATGKFKLLLVPNDSAYISVQTHANLIENLEIYNQGSTLNISEKKPIDSFESYVVYVYYNQDIEKITISDRVLMETQDDLITEEIRITANDATIIRQFNLIAKDAKIIANNKSEIEISGRATTALLKAKEYAKMELEDLDIKVAEVDLAGESDVKAKISKELTGRVLNNSTLYYEGTPSKDVDVKDRGEIIKD